MKFLLAITFLVGIVVSGNAQERTQIGIFQVALNEASPTRQTYGMPIVLHLESQSALPEQFHVRVIRGTKEWLIANGKSRANSCVIYYSAIIPIRRSQLDGTINLPAFENLTYLQTDGSHFAGEDYLLIFEQGDQPPDPFLRIQKNQLEEYFKYGFPMRLLPSGQLAQNAPRLVKAAEDAQKKGSTHYRDKAHQERVAIVAPPCWTVKTRTEVADVPNSRGSIYLAAALQPCGALPPPPSPLEAPSQGPAFVLSGQ